MQVEDDDEARADSIAAGQNSDTEMTHAAAFSPANNLQRHNAVVRTLTNERILPKVIDLLGFNICCYHYHVNVTPPAPGEPSALGMKGAVVPDAVDISNNVKTFRFHQDSGQPTDMEEEDTFQACRISQTNFTKNTKTTSFILIKGELFQTNLTFLKMRIFKVSRLRVKQEGRRSGIGL